MTLTETIEWVPAVERLPIPITDVFTFGPNAEPRKDWMYSNGEWRSGRHVTHWAPLPKGPRP